MDGIIGLISIIIFIVALAEGSGIILGCIGSLVITSILYLMISFFTTNWKVITVCILSIIVVIHFIALFSKKKQNKDDSYEDLISNKTENTEEYSSLYINNQSSDSKELERELLSMQIRDRLTLLEKEFVDTLELKKEFYTIESLIKEYMFFRNIETLEDFDDNYRSKIKGIAYLFSMDTCLKEIDFVINRIIKQNLRENIEKAKEEKQHLEKLGALTYIENFIINKLIKCETGDIKKEEYNEELLKLQKLLEYRINKKFSLKNIENSIKLLKNDIIKRYFIDKLNYNKLKSNDEVLRDYISIFGRNADNSFFLRQLSILISIDIEKVKQRMNEIIEEINIEYNTLLFEKELLQENSCLTLTDIDNLNGYEFEDYLVKLFSNLGYVVLPTPYSGDQGADLIIQDLAKKIVIQAKNYSGNVGNKAVQEAFAAKSHYNCHLAMVITNSYFTKSAQEVSKTTGVVLVDRDKLEEIIKNGKMAFLAMIDVRI